MATATQPQKYIQFRNSTRSSARDTLQRWRLESSPTRGKSWPPLRPSRPDSDDGRPSHPARRPKTARRHLSTLPPPRASFLSGRFSAYARDERATVVGIGRDGLSGGKTFRVLLQTLNAEEFRANRLVNFDEIFLGLSGRGHLFLGNGGRDELTAAR